MKIGMEGSDIFMANSHPLWRAFRFYRANVQHRQIRDSIAESKREVVAAIEHHPDSMVQLERTETEMLQIAA